MKLNRRDGWTMPARDPYYPPLPATYRNVRMQFVFFRADPNAVGKILPEPLEPSPDGLCMACGLTVPFNSNYGPFDETFVTGKYTFYGKIAAGTARMYIIMVRRRSPPGGRPTGRRRSMRKLKSIRLAQKAKACQSDSLPSSTQTTASEFQ